MLKRRSFKQTAFLQDRLQAFARDVRAKAGALPRGAERDDLLKKARQADTASRLNEWAYSSGLHCSEVIGCLSISSTSSPAIFSKDHDGVELPDAEAAHDMALDALVDAARDAVTEGTIDQRFAVEVRNGTGPVLMIRRKQ